MPAKYSQYLEINPSFESVVDIDADQRNANLWREYIVGQDMSDLVELMCQSLGNESPDARRSFWINGAYGTGKSYAGIFVKHLMEEKPDVIEDFMARNGRLSQYKNRFVKYRRRGEYLVVWKTGCTGIRTGDMMLIEAEKAVRDALVERFGDNARLGSASLMGGVLNKLNDPSINWDYMISTTTLGDDYDSAAELRGAVESGDLSAIQAVAGVLRDKGIAFIANLDTFKEWLGEVIRDNGLSDGGIFFIWDEFTEYVAYSDDHTIMQQISEFCKVEPFFMFYIVHKSRDLVARVGGDERYQLIVHRFHEVEFHLTADASLDLIAGSINMRVGMEQHWREARSQVVSGIRRFLPDMSGLDDRMADMIDRLCPMHPMTITLLSSVAQNFAASERTMFRFMKDRSNEDIGFVGYIHRFGPDDQACWLTPEWLWDYFFTRESDMQDNANSVAPYIRHYIEYRHLVESDDGAHRLFKIVMLLMAVSTTVNTMKYSGAATNRATSATLENLKLCLAGVMSGSQVEDLVATLEEDKLLVLDRARNGITRLQLPFSGGGDEYDVRYKSNDGRFTRYQMLSKDGAWAKAFEPLVWDSNDAAARRIKVCACAAEKQSINARLGEIKKELNTRPYMLGLLMVIVRDDAQHMGMVGELANMSAALDDRRITIVLVKTPLTDDKRAEWLKAVTRAELANQNGQTGSAGQYTQEADATIKAWAQSVTAGSRMTAWNGGQVHNNLYGVAHLRKTIQVSVLAELFPYSPETIVITNTAYKACNDSAPTAGIQRQTSNSQLRSVLNGMGNLLQLTSIDDMAAATGSKAADSVAQLARVINGRLSGGKLILGELWDTLMQPPFGYYDTIACGVILGFVFSAYKDSGTYSWTDKQQGSHSLSDATLKTMVLELVKGRLSTDYISAGTETFMRFRDYIKSIMKLSDAQTTNETECWHNMRAAVTRSGVPFWALKYLSESSFRSAADAHRSVEIVDRIQSFIQQDHEREPIMAEVNTLFKGCAVRPALAQAFSDKHKLDTAFRTFLFETSPELHHISDKLNIQPEELTDRLSAVMQGDIYSWTQDQVADKLGDIVAEYRYLDALNNAIGKQFHSAEAAQRELKNVFGAVRIPISALERLNKDWYKALSAMYALVDGQMKHADADRLQADADELSAHGRAAMDFLRDGKPALYELLAARGVECADDELSAIYSGLKDMRIDATWAMFDKELTAQIGRIAHARSRAILKERWRSLSGVDTVKEWCAMHGAPLHWIAAPEHRDAIATLIRVQNDQRTLDQDVTQAITALGGIDAALLSDDGAITDRMIALLGEECRSTYTTMRGDILTKAKIALGNDMSAWSINALTRLQEIVKQAQRDTARKKLPTVKQRVQTMDAASLRTRVEAFLEAHPEYCADFDK